MSINNLQNQGDKGSRISIDAKIDAVIEWIKKYPEISIKSLGNQDKKLKKYAKSEAEFTQLKNEYKKIWLYYDYLKARKRDNKLSPEQIRKCKDGKIGGVFGYPTEVEQLAQQYNISEEIADIVIKGFGSIENCIDAYYEEKHDKNEADFFREAIDIDEQENQYEFDKLAATIIGTGAIYSSEEIKQHLVNLPESQRQTIELFFGLYEKRQSICAIARKCNVSNMNIQKRREAGLDKLKTALTDNGNINEALRAINNPGITKDFMDLIKLYRNIFIQTQPTTQKQTLTEIEKIIQAKVKIIKLLAQIYSGKEDEEKTVTRAIINSESETITEAYLSSDIETIQNILNKGREKYELEILPRTIEITDKRLEF